MTSIDNETKVTLYEFSKKIKKMAESGHCEDAVFLIRQKMAQFPDAPEPHNLYGIILEKQRDTVGAMKHFRAAWALEPSYAPARQNMDRFGSFENDLKPAYSEEDCGTQKQKKHWFRNAG